MSDMYVRMCVLLYQAHVFIWTDVHVTSSPTRAIYTAGVGLYVHNSIYVRMYMDVHICVYNLPFVYLFFLHTYIYSA